MVCEVRASIYSALVHVNVYVLMHVYAIFVKVLPRSGRSRFKIKYSERTVYFTCILLRESLIFTASCIFVQMAQDLLWKTDWINLKSEE